MGRQRNTRASIMHIPEEIMVEILLLLPIKGIVMCKSTCKSWRYLISSAHFAKLHLSRAKEAILVRDFHSREISRMFYLIESSEINSNFRGCNPAIESANKIDLKFDTKLKVPLSKDDMVTWDPNVTATDDFRVLSYFINNSCNGLLCLSTLGKDNPTVVCNPITNEYIKIPFGDAKNWRINNAFGFCPKTQQYKVLRLKNKSSSEPFVETEIHTLGTNYWKSIGTPSFLSSSARLNIGTPLYLNGVLYWHFQKKELSFEKRILYFEKRILSFEFRSESFTLLPPPPIDLLQETSYLGKFKDSLSLSVVFLYSIRIFVFDIQKSWSKLITIPIRATSDMSYVKTPVISCSKCDEFLLFYCHDDWMNVFDPKRNKEKNLRHHRYRSTIEVLMYTPSFISLKDAAPGAKTQPI